MEFPNGTLGDEFRDRAAIHTVVWNDLKGLDIIIEHYALLDAALSPVDLNVLDPNLVAGLGAEDGNTLNGINDLLLVVVIAGQGLGVI